LRPAVTWTDVLSPCPQLVLYPTLIRAGFRRHSTYRQAALAGLTTNIVFGLLRAAVLLAVLAQRPVVAGYDVAAAVTFVWLGQGLLTVVLLWGDSDLSTRIRTGDVVVDLGRPWDLQAALLAGDLGRAGFAVLARLVPPMAFGALLFPIRWPERPVTWAVFALNASAFWLLDARGVFAVWGVVGGVLSGLVIPLAWFPEWARTALAFTPAPSLFQTPIDVFLERGEPVGALAGQAFWAVLLLGVGRVVLHRGSRRLVVQGG
jgi:ABC-2 type transport system permease protein